MSEKEIVEELNMSRTPVRQALDRLAGEKLITIISKKGIQISQISEKKVREVKELRIILERLIIQKAIENITEKDFDVLDSLHERLIMDLERTDALAVFKAGNDIHLFISEVADNETLTNMLKILRNESSRGYIYYLKSRFERDSEEQKQRIRNRMRESHEAILEALREKNINKATIAIDRDVNIFNEFIN